MSKAIVIEEFGGPEVMQWRDVSVSDPGAGEVLLRQTAVGLNFIDTYHRSGLYPLDLPTGLGTEAAGIVTAVGEGVTGLTVGDRVAYAGMPVGAYAEQRCFAADKLVLIPEGITEQIAAGAMLKGLTAWYLLKRSFTASSGDTVLLYAAAGGVGLIAAQWAHSLGVRVIGVVSTDEKAALARDHGCADIVMADDTDFVARVRGLTEGAGVAAVYDSIGQATFFQSLDCLAPFGTMVTYGNASGPVDPVAPLELARRGSLFLTRPVLFDFIATKTDLENASNELFAAILSADVTIEINQTWPMAEAAAAHRALEERRTTGSSLLTV
ncbi:MAG: quinone oxidoreductase [Gammaproteobacteria bacterium]|nr:MAG: quinone oxidoreductase [Gammaproteobacteria bacterium]